MEKFKSLVTRFQNLFKMDKNLSLVQRLKHTVIKFGLKKINIAYSRISLADIQSKLGLESVEETEQIVAKAIRDGVIEASISHDNQWMQSLQIVDLYSSNEPQQILHKRIQFTMQLHADAVKSLSYPQKDDKKDYGDFGDLDDNKDGDKDLLLSLLEEMGFEGDFD
jgi:26S proteasome regulatory subunit N3